MSSARARLIREMVEFRMDREADLFENRIPTGMVIFDDRGVGAGNRHVVGRVGGVKKETIYADFSQSPQRLALAIRRRKGPVYREVRKATRRYVLTHDQDTISEILAKRPRSEKAVRALVAAHPAMRRKCKACAHVHTARVHRGHGEGSFKHRGEIRTAAASLERPGDAPDWWDDLL